MPTRPFKKPPDIPAAQLKRLKYCACIKPNYYADPVHDVSPMRSSLIVIRCMKCGKQRAR